MGKLIDAIIGLFILCLLIVATLIVGVFHPFALLFEWLFSLAVIEEVEPQCEQCRKLWEGCCCDSLDKKECFVPKDSDYE